ncbi:MAG: acetylglutamate kinase [Lewinellaceae bacterium]|nr:acetylglutamate kinase [Phaeodactylibacter sp.]MCB9039879.1 acetylglutamate kinase [Lewinellaceae bacterium]
MKKTLHLFKIGGAILEDNKELEETLAFFSNLPGRKLLVHGGGRRASRMSRQLGIEPKLHEGRRITDAATLEVVVMVYAGLENKKVVSMLQALGCNAIGLSGADGNVILAAKRPVKDIDYGYVGDVKTINTQSLAALLEAGMTPALCAITHDGKGQLLNTNADTIAAELAIALTAQYQANLYYCFEKPGVMTDLDNTDSVIRFLDPELYAAYRQQGIIAEGMIPKLDNAFRALKAGAASVQVGDRKSLALGRATQLVWTTDFPESNI